jgi:signal transduction histidine kinase
MIAAVTVFQDITRLKEVERIKDEFTSIASHELRTPLTSLKAAGQLLLRRTRQGEYPPHGIGLINTIVQQADRMTRLIEELLDVSRIQSGKLPFKLEKFDLATLVTEAVETSQMSHPEYTFDVHADEQVLVRADKDRISQVLSNLLDNAVKYNTPGGSVRVGVRARENAQEAELTVTDRGIGFEPQQSEEVFERFARLGNVANHSRGMGLGLFICRQIMEAHGGNIEAHSDGPGKGATFTVTVPLAHAD